jgi:hypothetical protein
MTTTLTRSVQPQVDIGRAGNERRPSAAAYWLSVAAVVLAAVASATGVFVTDFYRDPAYWAARALAYLAYAYLFFAFGVAFNPLFPVYVAILSLAFWSLVLLLWQVRPERVRARVQSGMPERAIGMYLLALSALFLVVWMREILTSIVAGTFPPGVREANLPVNPTHVLDLAFLLPLCAFAGVRVWQHRAMGYVLAGVLLPATTLVAAFSAPAVGFGSMGEINAVLVPVLLFIAVALVGLVLTTMYLAHIRPSPAGREVT